MAKLRAVNRNEVARERPADALDEDKIAEKLKKKYKADTLHSGFQYIHGKKRGQGPAIRYSSGRKGENVLLYAYFDLEDGGLADQLIQWLTRARKLHRQAKSKGKEFRVKQVILKPYNDKGTPIWDVQIS